MLKGEPLSRLWCLDDVCIDMHIHTDEKAVDAEGRTPQQVMVLGRSVHHHASGESTVDRQTEDVSNGTPDGNSTLKGENKTSVTELVYVDEQVCLCMYYYVFDACKTLCFACLWSECT